MNKLLYGSFGSILTIIILVMLAHCTKEEQPPEIWFGKAYDSHSVDTVVTFLTLEPDSIRAARERTPGRFFIYAYGIPAQSLQDNDIFHGYCYGDTVPILWGCKYGKYLVMRLMEGAELPDGPTIVGIRKTDGHY